jgi:hypothetical protein
MYLINVVPDEYCFNGINEKSLKIPNGQWEAIEEEYNYDVTRIDGPIKNIGQHSVLSNVNVRVFRNLKIKFAFQIEWLNETHLALSLTLIYY